MLKAARDMDPGPGKSDPNTGGRCAGAYSAPESRPGRCPLLKQMLACPGQRGQGNSRALLLAIASAIRSSCCTSKSTTNTRRPGSKPSEHSASSMATTPIESAGNRPADLQVNPQDDYLEYTLNETTKTLSFTTSGSAKNQVAEVNSIEAARALAKKTRLPSGGTASCIGSAAWGSSYQIRPAGSSNF